MTNFIILAARHVKKKTTNLFMHNDFYLNRR